MGGRWWPPGRERPPGEPSEVVLWAELRALGELGAPVQTSLGRLPQELLELLGDAFAPLRRPLVARWPEELGELAGPWGPCGGGLHLRAELARALAGHTFLAQAKEGDADWPLFERAAAAVVPGGGQGGRRTLWYRRVLAGIGG